MGEYQPDFFYGGRYPYVPGYKARDTSKQAAEDMRPNADTLRYACLNALSVYGPSTADETADHLDETVLAIRPRFTELSHMNLIVDTGQRRKNRSGRNAIVWCLCVR